MSLITNPNAHALNRPLAESDEDRAPSLNLHRFTPITDYDKGIEELTRHLETRVVDVDAKILEGSGRRRQLVHYKNFREFAKSPMVRERVRQHIKLDKLKGVVERLRESNSFLTGPYPDEFQSSGTTFPLQDTFLPTLNSPYAKQQTFHDYMTSHVKCWEAATRNPLGKRIVKLVPQFVLARGLTCDIPETAHQEAWDAFWERHQMSLRLKTWLRELMTYGEQFNRHFKKGGKLAQRQIDPCTIWDVVTNLEDLEDVKYYYQQYVATPQVIVPGEKTPPSTLIIRHIPADEVDHFTINKTSSEKRGRSELYACISWLLRFKEFMNDRILANKMRAMFALDVAVEGGRDDVAAANQQFSQPLGPGAVVVHNKAIEVNYKNTNPGAEDAQTDAQMLLRIIAVGAGVSEQFLGISEASTRASALIQTEPDVKNFEDYQAVVELMLHKTYKRLVDVEGLKPTKKIFEVSFPALTAEDRPGKLKDLALMEAQQWITKERAATMAAREMGISKYDYDQEQTQIEKESEEEQLVMQGFQSVPKAAPDPMDMLNAQADAQMDLQTTAIQTKSAMAPNAKNDDGRKVASTSGSMGMSAKNLSGRSAANTSATLNRGGFTRGGEKASIKGRKSAGAPLRNSVWGVAARANSLKTRREGALARLREEFKELPETSTRRTKVQVRITELEGLLGHASDPSEQ